MKNYIIGTSGFAKEIENILFDNSPSCEVFFVSENSNDTFNKKINSREVISEKLFLDIKEEILCYIAVGNPIIKNKIYNKLKQNSNISFPNLISRRAIFDSRFSKMGFGNILCQGTIITINVEIGNFVTLNLNSTVGHDTVLKNFITVSPGVNISGNVSVGNQCYLGTNSCILEKLSLIDNSIIGAGCVVNKTILEKGTYVGVPAKKIK